MTRWYLVIPGGTGSFPKYHLVILPLLAWLAAEELVRGPAPRPGVTVALLALGVAYYGLIVGDPLLLLNHDLRHAQLAGQAGQVLTKLELAAGLTLLFPLALLALLRRWRPALVIAVAASHLALVLVQRVEDVRLVGRMQVIEKLPGGRHVIAVQQITQPVED